MQLCGLEATTAAAAAEAAQEEQQQRKVQTSWPRPLLLFGNKQPFWLIIHLCDFLFIFVDIMVDGISSSKYQ